MEENIASARSAQGSKDGGDDETQLEQCVYNGTPKHNGTPKSGGTPKSNDTPNNKVRSPQSGKNTPEAWGDIHCISK